MPTDVGTFYLDCDASDVGLGSVLSQQQGGSEVVIAVEVVEPPTSAPSTASASASSPIPAAKADTSAADVTSSLME